MKLMNEKAISARTNEFSFMWMLFACIQENTKFDIEEILDYWFTLAFQREALEADFNNTLIDKIRIQLLINNGISKPILKNSYIWEKIKNHIQF